MADVLLKPSKKWFNTPRGENLEQEESTLKDKASGIEKYAFDSTHGEDKL